MLGTKQMKHSIKEVMRMTIPAELGFYLKPFDIVSAPYTDTFGQTKINPINGKQQYGLFLVLDVHDGNVLACKITSQRSKYTSPATSYELRQESHPFLMAPSSYVQCLKMHTLDKSTCKYLGCVAEHCRCGLLAKLTNVATRVKLNLQRYAPAYRSPNLYGRDVYRPF